MILSITDSRKWPLHLATLAAGGVAVTLFALWALLYQTVLYTVQGEEYRPIPWSVPCTITTIDYSSIALAGSIVLRLGIGLWALQLVRERIREDRWLAAMMLLPLFLLMGVDLNTLLGAALYNLAGLDVKPLTNALLGEAAFLGRNLFGSIYPVTAALVVAFGWASILLSREIVERLQASGRTGRVWLAMVMSGIMGGSLVWSIVVGRVLWLLAFR